MKYILSEKEYAILTKWSDEERKKNDQLIFDLCRKVCDNMPVDWGWGGNDPKPWGCMVTELIEDDSEWFCDECPVQIECPYQHKKYSK